MGLGLKKPPKGGSGEADHRTSESAEKATPEQPARQPLEPKTTSTARKLGRLGPQRRVFTMPVSKEQVECALQQLDPADCVVSPDNIRSDVWLNMDNPAMHELYSSIKARGQDDPILAKAKKDAVTGKVTYEVIYGSRRHFAVSQLAQEGVEIRLVAWVSTEIPDVDIYSLSAHENEARDSISTWEKAQDYARRCESDPLLKDKDISTQAAILGMTRSTLSRHLSLATLPVEWAALLSNPNLIPLQKGIKLSVKLSEMDDKERSRAFASLKENAPYETMAPIMAAIAEKHEAKTPDRMLTPIRSNSGEEAGQIDKDDRVPTTIRLKSGDEAAYIAKADRGYMVTIPECTDALAADIARALEKVLRKHLR